jgi:hypothetical protein
MDMDDSPDLIENTIDDGGQQNTTTVVNINFSPQFFLFPFMWMFPFTVTKRD